MSLNSPAILQRVASFIESNRLLNQPSSQPLVYVGLSGGPDSVALLHILRSLGYDCQALHCNFHLRGEESNRDQDFCESLCRQLQIEIIIEQFDTREYMKSHHLSLEMAARELRYQWWKKMMDEQGTAESRIALGHHQDDSIETMLMNLMRGTGIKGLTGIVPYNQSTKVIRPLLCMTREEILEYLDENKLSYVVDSSNLECDTMRNQIRNKLLPEMMQIAPQTKHAMVSAMSHLAAAHNYAKQYLKQFFDFTEERDRFGIKWHEIDIETIQQSFVGSMDDFEYEWGLHFCDPLTHKVVRNKYKLFTYPKDESIFETNKPLIDEEIYNLKKEDSALIKEGRCECFDADTIKFPLVLRRWQTGDRMMPLGMEGRSKLVSDLFQNAHFSAIEKATTWLIVDATGSIVWVLGLRISDLHKVTTSTTRVLKLTCRN